MHWLQGSTNLLHLNVTYTPTLADGPLLTMIQRIQGIAPALLPRAGVEYRDTYANDTWPLLWRLFPPFTTDAYDVLYHSLFVAGVAGALRLVPLSGRWLGVFLNKALFKHRQIPVYQRQAFFAGLQGEYHADPQQHYVTGYISDSFTHYQQMGPAPDWVYLSPVQA